MLELRDATRVVDVIGLGDVYVAWSPGDATLYRVGLVNLIEYGANALRSANDVRALLVVVGVHDLYPHLLIHEPRDESQFWTAARFHVYFGERYSGWWAGVRPLLAALAWTPVDRRETRYDANDSNEMALLVLNSVRPRRLEAS